jgi:hypothetical protein
VKFDGYRVLVRVAAGKVRLLTCGGEDWTERMPSLAQAAGALKVETQSWTVNSSRSKLRCSRCSERSRNQPRSCGTAITCKGKARSSLRGPRSRAWKASRPSVRAPAIGV